MPNSKKKRFFAKKPHYHKKPEDGETESGVEHDGGEYESREPREQGESNPERAVRAEASGGQQQQPRPQNPQNRQQQQPRPAQRPGQQNRQPFQQSGQQQPRRDAPQGERGERSERSDDQGNRNPQGDRDFNSGSSRRNRRSRNKFRKPGNPQNPQQQQAGQNNRRDEFDTPERVLPPQVFEDENSLPLDPNAPICPVCNEPIRSVLTAIRHKESGQLAHFDCIVKDIRAASGDKLGKHRKIYYIGAGNFAIVRERYDKRGRLRSYHIIERISYESKNE